MTVCYFGNFDPEYARNRVLIKGLRENGVEVIICRTHLRGFKRYSDLYRQIRDLKGKYDLMIVGYSDSRFTVPLAKIISRKPVIWDAFYSIFDARVNDRRHVRAIHPRGIFYWLADWSNSVLADLILLDTFEHIEYFRKTFIISKRKFIRVFIGADDSVFYP